MNSKHLGNHFDIHGGGSDLQFPHHENEIAQSCCAHGGDYVNTWMHSGMVMVDKEKMSKSLGNFFTIRDVLAHYDAETVRYFLMSGHYRSQLNYSEDNLKQARAALERMYTALRDLPVAVAAGGDEQVARFKEAMDDDFNTPEAYSALFDLVREINRQKAEDINVAAGLGARLRELGAVLGILQQDPEAFLKGDEADEEVAEIERLISDRNQARADKNWAAADAARNRLTENGYSAGRQRRQDQLAPCLRSVGLVGVWCQQVERIKKPQPLGCGFFINLINSDVRVLAYFFLSVCSSLSTFWRCSLIHL